MSSLFTDLKHKNMKGIKRKLEQLTYEIKLVKCDENDTMNGVMVRLEELTDLVNKLLIPDVSGRSEQLPLCSCVKASDPRDCDNYNGQKGICYYCTE